MKPSGDIFSHRKHWAARFGVAPFLPMSRAEMDALGWDSCDVILVTGDAYVDHPSFGMAIVGRLLEAQGVRVLALGLKRVRAVTNYHITAADIQAALRVCHSLSLQLPSPYRGKP